MSKTRGMSFGVLAGFSLVLGCGGAVLAPDAKSGPDQSWENAQVLDLDIEDGEGEAEVTDSVTFPGGDRVDWRVISVPGNGILTVTMAVQPARPGLTAEINLLDSGYRVVGKTNNLAATTSKKVKVKEAEKNKYYIQVYAPRKSDAAVYELSVSFKKSQELAAAVGAPPPLFGADLLPDPEPLAAPPDPNAVAALPPGGVPPGGMPPGGMPGMPGMPGGVPGMPGMPGGVPGMPPTPTPPPVAEDPPAGPVVVTIQDMAATAGGTLLIVAAGTNKGIAVGWKGKILRGKTDKALSNGDVKVKKVFGTSAQLETKLSLESIGDNTRVKLEP